MKERDVGFSQLYSNRRSVDTHGVIVEDLVSGIHILEAHPQEGIKVVVNYGVKVNLEALHSLAHIPRVHIWLDNDGDHVLSQADTMTRTLAMMSQGKVTQVSPSMSDPKHYKSDEIRGVLNG